MTDTLRILHLEDDATDALLTRSTLEAEGLRCDIEVVDTRQAFESALEARRFDVILADYMLPAYDGAHALAAARRRQPETPFIVLTGALGEELAVECLKNGATDYLLKQRIDRLAPAIERARREAADRQRREALESEREATIEILRLISQPISLRDLARALLGFLQRQTGCDAVGLRLESEEDFPYFETRGFESEFVEKENSLCCRDRDGRPMRRADGQIQLDCLCGRALGGAFEVELSRVTENGSFWTDDTAELKKQVDTLTLSPPVRLHCLDAGYRSVALIPLRQEGRALGLLQFNDRRSGLFDSDLIARFERLAANLALGLAERRARENLTAEARLNAALAELGNALVGAGISYEETSRLVMRHALDLTRSPHGFVSVVESGSGDNICQVISNLMPDGGDPVSTPLTLAGAADGRYPGLWGHALNERRAFFTNSLADHPAAAGLPAGHAPVACFLTAPALVEGRLVGQIAVANAPGGYRDADVHTLERLAALYAASIHRLRGEAARVQLTEAIDHAGEMVILVDPAGIVRYINPAVEALSGWSRAERLGQPLAALEAEESPGRLSAGIGATHPVEGRFLHRRRDGSAYPVEGALSPVVDGAGRLTGYVAVLRDVTREMEMEARLRQTQKMEALGTLAAGIAHDFNNILQSIVGFSDLAIGEAPPKSRLHDCLVEVRQAGVRAKQLIAQILAFSRQSEQVKRSIHLHTVLKEALKMLRGSLPATIEITQDIDGHCGPVMADVTQIHQVLMNLCANAAHAMRARGGRLSVKLEEVRIAPADQRLTTGLTAGRHALLTVADSGHGMSEEVLKRIFDPYFTTKPQGEGTGMGLAVVMGIVHSHNGVITVDSQPGEGSIFRVYFPVCEASVAAGAPEAGEIHGGNERLLVVDDEEMIVRSMRGNLTRLGYDVEAYSSSIEALERFQADPARYDLVITDLTMPFMTGAELARLMLTARPELPIILCTGYNEMITPERARQIGFEHFILKPIVTSDLAECVRQALEKTVAPGQS